ncbi:hypothetical protein Hanom_Chr07g00665171 [Helianthus anomalus]
MSICRVNNDGSLPLIGASRSNKRCILSHLWRQNLPPFSMPVLCCKGNPSSHARFPHATAILRDFELAKRKHYLEKSKMPLSS